MRSGEGCWRLVVEVRGDVCLRHQLAALSIDLVEVTFLAVIQPIGARCIGKIKLCLRWYVSGRLPYNDIGYCSEGQLLNIRTARCGSRKNAFHIVVPGERTRTCGEAVLPKNVGHQVKRLIHRHCNGNCSSDHSGIEEPVELLESVGLSY